MIFDGENVASTYSSNIPEHHEEIWEGRDASQCSSPQRTIAIQDESTERKITRCLGCRATANVTPKKRHLRSRVDVGVTLPTRSSNPQAMRGGRFVKPTPS